MKTVDSCIRLLACWVLCLLGTTTGAWAEEPSRFSPGDGRPVGVVTAISGGSALIGSGEHMARSLKAGDRVVADSEISTGAGTTVTLLWDHRLLLTVHEETRLRMTETHHGQTEVQLHNGSLRIALSFNAGRMTDKLTLQTALSRVVSRGGILEATVVREEQRSFFARLLNVSPVDTLRMFEGQARIEPLTGEGKPFSIKTGSEVSIKSGAAPSISEMRPDAGGSQSIAVKREHRDLPRPVTRQIINAHVGLALESEKEIQRTAIVGNEVEQPGTSTKGAILATTTGLPSFTSVQAGGGNAAVTSSASVSGAVVAPPSSAVSIPVAGGGTGSAQSGGLNSNGLLKQILNEVGKGSKGKDKK